MAHDVFISYSTKDKPVADAVCAKLEAEGLRCWIAPRDILPGMDWGGALIEAIESAHVMVLVLSASADASPQIQREVERAVNKGLRIVPLRIEDIKPGKNLEYFLGTPHWLDAITPPLETHLQYLAQTIKVLLGQEHAGAEEKLPPPLPPSGPPSLHNVAIPKVSGSQRLMMGAIAATVILLVGAILWFRHGGAIPSRIAGTWATTGFAGPDKVQFSLDIERNGTYRYDVNFRESGRVRVQSDQVYLITTDGTERPVGPIAPGSSPPMIANLVDAAPASVWPLIGRFSGATPQLPETNPFKLSQSAQVTGAGQDRPAVWEWAPAFGRVVWQLRFEFDQAGGYTFAAIATDLGGFTAHEGKWTASSDILNTRSEGNYSFVGSNSLVMTGTIRGALSTTRNGQTLWERSTAVAAALASPAAPLPSLKPSPTTSASGIGSLTPESSQTPTIAIETPTPAPKPSVRPIDRRFLVAHDSPIYAGPDISSAVLTNVRRGKRIHVTGITGDWLRVEFSNGIVGFIPDQALE